MDNAFMVGRTGLPIDCYGVLAIAVFAMCSLGCGAEETDTPTGPSPTLVTETFSGSISRNSTGVHAFTVNSSGYTLLAGYTSIAPSSVPALGLGVGSWDASTSTCSLNVSQSDIARSGNTALSGSANSGAYCLRVYDGGNIPDGVTATYTVQVQHY
jgi:hypothetical protein